MAISKNNPAIRDNQRLFVSCPTCASPMVVTKRVPGGMFYVCEKDRNHVAPITPGSYKDMPHQWARKK